MSKNYTFKPIKPYETETVIRSNELSDEALEALKGLGYKASELKLISERLKERQFETSAEYLKEGLRLLNDEKKQFYYELKGIDDKIKVKVSVYKNGKR